MKNQIKTYLLLLLTLVLSACGTDPCRFNIDKHEILTGIDVPKTIGGACIPNEDGGFKLSVWELDTLNLQESSVYGSVEGFKDHFRFEKLEGRFHPEKISLLPEKYQESVREDELFFRSGERGGKRWIMILSINSAMLLGEIIDLKEEDD